MLETQFERVKVGWAPYNLKQHDYGLEVPTDNRADRTPQLLLFCVFILFSGPREGITSTKEKLFWKQGMRESILKVLWNPHWREKNIFYCQTERFVISKYLILSYRPYQFYFYLQFKFVWHKESIFVTIIANLSIFQEVFPSFLSKDKKVCHHLQKHAFISFMEQHHYYIIIDENLEGHMIFS